ncbi:MAG TPA: protein translocase subunit SecF [Stellaceae bacterium]|jgi:preprotein translocase subunit SecF|nr:protein translocase subunit SecF [Stellaceae bacterium]
MRPLIIIRRIPNINFMGMRQVGFALSLLMTIASIALFFTRGLNYGIDFSGGTIIEVRSTTGAADLNTMRADLDSLGLRDVTLQNFGGPDDVLIRLQEQSDKTQEETVNQVKQKLGSTFEYRRTEVVGPTVGAELIKAGVEATILALFAIAFYVWFRFEWPFGVGAMLSTLHDTITTIGLFSLLQIEFNLTTLAAILTIAGYSINDTVVIYDRVRETMRRYKSMEFAELINKSLNETLSRTILTVSTTALAVLCLLLFGGEVLRGFSIAMLWGIVVGTYSSLFIAAPMLYYIRPKRAGASAGEAGDAPARGKP